MSQEIEIKKWVAYQFAQWFDAAPQDVTLDQVIEKVCIFLGWAGPKDTLEFPDGSSCQMTLKEDGWYLQVWAPVEENLDPEVN